MKQKKCRGIESIKSKYGMLFVAPWTIGFIVFFLVPVFQSILYSFCDITLNTDGVSLEFVSVENYKYFLFEDPNFTKNLTADLSSLLYSLPIILLLSVVLALLLNQKMRGRLFFRVVFHAGNHSKRCCNSNAV